MVTDQHTNSYTQTFSVYHYHSTHINTLGRNEHTALCSCIDIFLLFPILAGVLKGAELLYVETAFEASLQMVSFRETIPSKDKDPRFSRLITAADLTGSAAPSAPGGMDRMYPYTHLHAHAHLHTHTHIYKHIISTQA